MTDSPQIRHEPGASRFATDVDGQLAQLQYERRGRHLVITHTLVPAEIGGRGIGAALVATAVDHAIAEQLEVVPRCWYADRWLAEHPDIAAKVTDED